MSSLFDDEAEESDRERGNRGSDDDEDEDVSRTEILAGTAPRSEECSVRLSVAEERNGRLDCRLY